MSSRRKAADDGAASAEIRTGRGDQQSQADADGAALPPGLYVTATPIGHARDLSFRALEVLTKADLIAAEDTRVTVKLLSLYGIQSPMISYREENATKAGPLILRRLAEGACVALVTDAGTPGVSDPGAVLVAEAAAAGHRIVSVPGPSALAAAWSLSGMTAAHVLFAGFLPARGAERRAALIRLKSLEAALVFYESPHRIAESLADMAAILGPRPAVLCRELTKRHEETRRGTIPELAALAGDDPNLSRGEIVLVIGPPEAEAETASAEALDAALTKALATMSVKEAAGAVAGALGLARRSVYARALQLKEGA